MIRRRLAIALLAVVTSGCAAPQPVATPQAAPSGPSPSGPSFRSPSPSTSSIDTSRPFWLQPPIVVPGMPSSTCGYVAVYQATDGPPIGLGGCAGTLPITPPATVLHVRQTLALHMTSTPAEGGPAAEAPLPLPDTPDEAILRQVSTSDNRTTGAFEAMAPGTVVLRTTGVCIDVLAGTEVSGPCAVLQVQVLP